MLDWNFEANVDYTVMNANHEYIAEYLAEFFGRLCPLAYFDVDATAFGNALKTGSLPLTSVRLYTNVDQYLHANASTASIYHAVKRAGGFEGCVWVRDPKTCGVRALPLGRLRMTKSH